MDKDNKICIRMSEKDMDTLKRATQAIEYRTGLTLKTSDVVRYALNQIARRDY